MANKIWLRNDSGNEDDSKPAETSWLETDKIQPYDASGEITIQAA